MGSSSFVRIRLLPEGLWPPGVRQEDVRVEDALKKDAWSGGCPVGAVAGRLRGIRLEGDSLMKRFGRTVRQ